MIVTEIVNINGKDFIHNYSDSGFYIKKRGKKEFYEEAYDIPEVNHKYIETKNLIKKEDLKG